MIFKIGLIPTIKENYKNQFSYVVDTKWFSFLNKIYKKPEITILNKNKFPKLNLVILTGGNTSTKFLKKNENYLRERLDRKVFKKILQKNIPCVGICWGAQSIIQMYNGRLFKGKNHIGHHKINLINKKFKKKFKKNYNVNSYHNQIIKNVPSQFEEIFISKDGSTEMFKHKRKKIFGILWHPERNKKITSLDKIIFNKIICN